MKRYQTVILVTILIVAAILRFYKLDSYPALNADEAAIGYNAYSLIQTGKDEHGNPWPIHFQSFNDYKPGLYVYLVLPFVKILGLNEWAIRIPGAFLGVSTVLIVYLLVKELIGSGLRVAYVLLPLISAFFLAISPWHIHFSRGGWEVNVATFFITLGLLLFIKAVNGKIRFEFCVSSFALSLYTYHAARLVVPLLGLGLIVINKDVVKKNLKHLLLAGLVGFVVLLPLVKDFTKPDITSRATGVGLFADPGIVSKINEQRGEHGDFQGLVPIVFHNKVVNYGLAFLENWSEHYHGEFLFLSGDVIQRNKVPETGQMYLFDLVLIIVGLIAIAKKPSKGWKLIIWWLMIAPTAAALTFQSPHALRAQNMIIPLIIISTYGLITLVEFINKIIKSKFLLFTAYCLLFAVITWNFTRYLHMYWVHMAKEYPFSSQYGVKELVDYVRDNESRYEKIIVTNRYDQPYILFLFYLKYPPEKFQKEHALTSQDKYGFSTVGNFNKYYFGEIDWDNVQANNPNSLIIGTDEEIPKKAGVIKEIFGSNGYKYFQIVAN